MRFIKLTDNSWRKTYRVMPCLKLILFKDGSTIGKNMKMNLRWHMSKFPCVIFFLARCERFSFLTSMYNPINRPCMVLLKCETVLAKLYGDDVDELESFLEMIKRSMTK